MWNAPGRFYHSETHLDDLLRQIDATTARISATDRDKLMLAAIFHDIIYDPAASDNEEHSAQFLLAHCCGADAADVIQIIRDTASHKPSTPLSRIFNDMDMDIMNRPWPELLAWEDGIYLEYAPVVGSAYKQERLDFLQSYTSPSHPNRDNLARLMLYVDAVC
jgi:predicted metal-dependent HD superfamily phosphohydrolase